MNMGQLKYGLVFLVVMLAGCAGNPVAESSPPVQVVEPVPEPAAEPAPAPAEPEQAAEEVFEPAAISQEVFDTTKTDVQHFIEELNRIIRNKNYNAWKAHLSDEYFAYISSAEYLKSVSESAAMRVQKKVLRSAADYFNFVVVPSRANSRVDDIEFSGEHIVKAFTLGAKNERLRLYELERTGDTWKIIN